MQNLNLLLKTSSRAISYVIGSAVVALAIGVAFTSWQPERIAAWALKMFGLSFVGILTLLILMTVFCWVHILDADNKRDIKFWHETGQHPANGIATLALTYTLFGISMGIGTLSGQDLNPETINGVIKTLTNHFSLAFLTTIVGLPLAAVSRAFISISATKRECRIGDQKEGDSYEISTV